MNLKANVKLLVKLLTIIVLCGLKCFTIKSNSDSTKFTFVSKTNVL